MWSSLSEWSKRWIARGYQPTTIKDLMTASRSQHTAERYQVEKRQSRFTYTDGPMKFLGQQIVKRMEDSGFPAMIHTCYRSPQEQARLYAKGRSASGRIVTKAKPWSSAHQLWEAVDIVHPELFWNASPEYWDTLAACVRAVSEQYGVKLNHGHNWRFVDSAHIEIQNWRIFKEDHRERCNGSLRPLSAVELWDRFREVLPAVSRAYLRDHRGQAPAVVENERAMEAAAASLSD